MLTFFITVVPLEFSICILLVLSFLGLLLYLSTSTGQVWKLVLKVIVVCCAVHWFSKGAVLKVLRKLVQLLSCDIDELQVSV